MVMNVIVVYRYREALSVMVSGADPGFDQGGGPDRDRPKLPTVRSSVM